MTLINDHIVDIRFEISDQVFDKDPLEVAVLATFVQANVSSPCEVVVVVADDDVLRDLNRRFLGINEPTDVLSFPNDSRGPFSGGSAGFPQYLGDIIISLPQAQRQAEEAGGTVVQELQLLVVHGTLHLLGYDHDEAKEKAQMWAIQEAILKQLNVDIPLPE
ncbi:MAG: rRNA maturation RNase YbeY [Anaerolineae bacterium]|nr:rRNA maturation RNase YbeY [Anaerolineae bacterium]